MAAGRSVKSSAAILVVLLLGSALLPQSAMADPAPRLQGFYSQQLTWQACDDGLPKSLSCATIAAPLDYTQPNKGDVTIAISRSTARDPVRRRGILLVNPGGPGESGLLAAAFLAKTPLATVYDIIGFDPRGVGRSTQARCEESPETPRDSRPSDASFSTFAAIAQTVEAGCQRVSGAIRPYITTTATAKDLDLIRAALGETRMNYLGFSYGTYLGAVYGQLFPQRLDRTVLDSSVHPDWIWRRQFLQQAVAIRGNVDQWMTWTAERNLTFGLGATPDAVHGTVESVASQLAMSPVEDVDRTTFDMAIGGAARYRPLWAQLSQIVADLRAGKNPDRKSRVKHDAAKATGLLAEEFRSAQQSGVFETITCEAPWPRSLEVYYADMRVFRTTYPYGGGVSKAAPTNCAFATYQPADTAPTLSMRGYPEGLVVQADGDTQTQYAGGQAMAQRLGHRLLTVRGEGNHALYGSNPCVTTHVTTYLLDGTLPAPGTECTGKPPPAVPVDAAGERTFADSSRPANLERSVRDFLHNQANPLLPPRSWD